VEGKGKGKSAGEPPSSSQHERGKKGRKGNLWYRGASSADVLENTRRQVLIAASHLIWKKDNPHSPRLLEGGKRRKQLLARLGEAIYPFGKKKRRTPIEDSAGGGRGAEISALVPKKKKKADLMRS